MIEMSDRMINGLVIAWLWRQGGKSNKDWRRIIAPIFLYLMTFNIAFALCFAVLSRIPITLIGDSLHKRGQLFWWVPILCLLHALPVYLVAGQWVACSLFLIQSGMIIGSNTVDFPKWNWYEKVYGFLLGSSI